MKLKRILALLLIFTMILPSFLTPLKYVALATGENNFELVFTGHDLVFNNDGSVSLNVYREDEEPAAINIKVYNDYNEQIDIQDLTDIYAIYYAENPELQGLKIAGCTIPFDAITGCYLEITSANADLNMIRFFIGNNDYSINQDERIYLPADVLDDDFPGIDFRQIIDLNAKKRVAFKGTNLSIEENTLTMDSPLPYTEGTLSFTVYNYDDSVVTPEFYYEDDPETHQLVLSTTDAFAKLNSSIYDGAYMMVTATGNVDLTDVKLHCNDAIMYIDNTGRIDLSDETEYIEVSSWGLRNINEKKEVYVEGNNLVVSGNTITMDSPIEDNEGRITFAFYNVDDSAAIVSPRMDWNEQLGQDVPSDREANVILKRTSYLGSYMVVSGDQDFDMSNIKFRLDGEDTYLAEGNKVYFPADADNVSLGNWAILPLIEKKELSVRGNNIEVNNNTITIDSPIEGNVGRITFAFYNSDNTAARAERRVDYYDHETEQDVYSETEAVVRFNTTTYEGTYMIVTSTSNPPVDLTNMRIELPGVYPYPTVPASGRIDFPAQADWINLDEYTIRPLYEKKQINIAGDNLVISGNVATFDSPIVGNEGRLTLTFYNSDNSPMSLQQYHIWNESLGQDELDPRSGWAQLNTTTYAGAYFIVSSTSNPAVDLTDIKFNFNGEEYLLGQDHKVTFTAEMDNYWVNIDEHSIMEVNTRKNIQFYNDNIVLNTDNTVTLDCTVEGNQGRLTIGAYNSDGTKVALSRGLMWNFETGELEPGPTVSGKFNTSTFTGTYLEVVSDGNVDLTKILFAFGNDEVAVSQNGKVYIPNTDMNWITVSDETIRNIAKNSVTVNATVTDGRIYQLRVNNVDFIDMNSTQSTSVSEVHKTCQVDQRTNDVIDFSLEYGYIIKELTINNEQIAINGNQSWYSGTFAHCDSYTIEMVCELNILPEIRWSYIYDDSLDVEEVLSEGIVEIVSVTLPDGVTTYTAEEIELIDEPGIGYHFPHEEEARLGYAIDPRTQEITGGSLAVLPGSTVTLKIIPDFEFQLTSTQLEGTELVPDNNEIAQYTMVMPDNNVRIAGIIYYTRNTLVSETELVESGYITIEDTEFDAGSAIATVKDVNQATLDQAGFEAAATEGGYQVVRYFDIELNQVIYKGSEDDVWSIGIDTLEKAAIVELKLAEGVDRDTIVIIHHIDNSGEFEIIPIVSYDRERNMIKFKATNFGDEYAIAAKDDEPVELNFPDVEAGRWYINSIEYVFRKGLMGGYATGNFGPNDKITRGQIVTILYREAGSPVSTFNMQFDDVQDPTKYYYDAVRWAAENEIVTGYMSGPDAGKFKPNDNVTREQLAVILQRYAKYKGKDFYTLGDLTTFSDYKNVSNYAIAGMRWAVGVGIIKGNADGTLNPKGTASRAEAATMIMRFLEELY